MIVIEGMSMRCAVAFALFLGITGSPVAAGQVPSAEPKAATANDADRKICKSSPQTGSLVKKRKQCFTKREWARIAQGAREQGIQLQDGNSGRPPGEF